MKPPSPPLALFSTAGLVAIAVTGVWWLGNYEANTARDGLRQAARAERRLYEAVNPSSGTSTI
jgi:predicted exporter